MVKNHHLAKSINDASWGKFFKLLSDKAEEAGRKVIKIPRFEPTSKTCSECGTINRQLTSRIGSVFASPVAHRTAGITMPQKIFVGSGRPFKSKRMALAKAYLENPCISVLRSVNVRSCYYKQTVKKYFFFKIL